MTAIGLVNGLAELGVQIELRGGRLHIHPPPSGALATQTASYEGELGHLFAAPLPGAATTRAANDERDLPRLADVLSSGEHVGVSSVSNVLAVSVDGRHVELITSESSDSVWNAARGLLGQVAVMSWGPWAGEHQCAHGFDLQMVGRVLEMAGEVLGCTGSVGELLSAVIRSPLQATGGRPDASPAYQARCLATLAQPLLTMVRDAGLEAVIDLERRVARVLRAASDDGIRFDVRAWYALVDREGAALEVADGHVRSVLGVGLAKDHELLLALEERGIPVRSLEEEELDPWADSETIREITRGRRARAFLTQFGRPYARMLSATSDGVLHPRFEPLGDTGRISASEPALMSFPRDEMLRRCIVPRAGHVFVRGDYSASQLRVTADYVGVPKLRELFNANADVHKWTASKYLRCDPSQVQAQRAFGKAANFSLLFDVGVDGFRRQARKTYGVRLNAIEAVNLMNTFFEAFPEVRAWHDRESRYATDYITTPLGRRVSLARRGYNARLAAPIQAIEADALKQAMVWADDELRGRGGRVMLPVHDALILEVPSAHAAWAEKMLEEVMRRAMSLFVRSVPIAVETGRGFSMVFA